MHLLIIMTNHDHVINNVGHKITESQSPLILLLLDRSHRTESNDSIQPLSHALIGGVQPKYGWWAPVAALYKEVGAGAHDTRFAVASRPTNIPIRSRSSASHRKSSPPPIAMASGSNSSSSGAGTPLSLSLPLSDQDKFTTKVSTVASTP
jgi:hypothetical protein